MQGDDLSVAYTDAFPATLTDFRHEVAQGEKLLLVCLVDGQVAGALWLHDLLRRRDGSVSAGWAGGYFLPSYRGYAAVGLWQIVRQHWEDVGIRHIFCAVNIANRLSQAFVTRGMHFHRVGCFRDFAFYHGQPTDLIIYTLHSADTALAWELATARAERQMFKIAS
jgi:RimJ/RimL family protein N-acetyltransferase